MKIKKIFSKINSILSNKIDSKKEFHFRNLIAFTVILILLGVLITRAVYIQIIKHDEYHAKGTANQYFLIPTPPIRGEIMDKNGISLAKNSPSYSLEIVIMYIRDSLVKKNNKELKKAIDQTIEDLKKYIDITASDIKRFERFRSEYGMSNYESIPLKLNLTIDEASQLAPHLYQFKGVKVEARTVREYPFAQYMTHVIGYIGRISQNDLETIQEKNLMRLYRGTTHIGKEGLEKFYESQLHGIPGYQEIIRDVKGNIVDVIKTVTPKSGKTLRLSMDIRMQIKADQLLGNRRGAVVAIDPKTGQILALVSKPSYDGNLFVDGIDSETWKGLSENWEKPLINRAIRGLYPPGSTFKPFMGIVALQSGKLTPQSVLPSPGAWSIPGSKHLFRDVARGGHGIINLSKAIQVSSDTFFYKLGYEMGIDTISKYLKPFGFGEKTGIDLPNESSGILPSTEWKANRYKDKAENIKKWYPADTVSVSIGQGYNIYTPLQMAYATAILANDGIVFKPHLVEAILDFEEKKITRPELKPVNIIDYKKEFFSYIKDAMERVLKPGGGSWRIGQGLKYRMGGKTGTAQVIQIKQGSSYNAAALREQHRDHSWFIAFAPVDDPKIAVAILIENGGWGANSSPIAKALIDYYLLELPNHEINEKKLIEEYGQKRIKNFTLNEKINQTNPTLKNNPDLDLEYLFEKIQQPIE